MSTAAKPLLPLVLADVPPSLGVVLAQEGVSTVLFATEPTGGRFVLYDSRRTHPPQIDADQQLVDVDDVRQALSFDPFAELESTATCRTFWRVGPWEAAEETAMTDRAAVREAVAAELRRMLEARGGVWMHVAPVPRPYRTSFTFRFDHDAYVADDFDAVLTAIAGRERMTTHFVCAATHEAHAVALGRLDGCDFGSHGYRHHTYRTVDENVRNIARGIDALRRLGCEPSGFAAPHGRYHAELAAALHACGITHSSEFAAAYDDLPYLPPGGDVWQIPIHPVCLGIVLEAVARIAPHDGIAQRRAADDVADYFIAAAEARRAAGAPIVLYGHPDGRLGRYPHVVRNVLDVADGWSDVWRTNFTQLQQWQRARAAIRLTVRESADGYDVAASNLPTGYACALDWHSGDAAAVVLLDRPQLSLRRESTTFTRRLSCNVPQPVRREPIGGFKERLRRALDWEYATPVDEIDARPWRGRLKRSLRLWKERVR